MFVLRHWHKVRVRISAIATCAVFFASLLAPNVSLANPKYAGIVMDANSGKTLYKYAADSYRFPASLTKVMTLYLIFEELEAGRLSLNSRLKVSKFAAARPPSKIGLRVGGSIRVKDAILALVTKSANDVATVVAENISGSEKSFAQRMTRTARNLGMSKTTFRNPHGLPNSGQRTTARDMARLGIAVQEHFPQYYGYFKTRSYKYGKRTYSNHNRLLGTVRGVDGIKTGYIRASGFNLLTSVNKDGRSIVAVVMGGKTGASRNAQMTKLIGRYLRKATKRRKRNDLIARKSLPRKFVAAKLKNPPVPTVKPRQTKPLLLAQSAVKPVSAAVSPVLARQASASTEQRLKLSEKTVVPQPKTIASRLNTTFAVAQALPPLPKKNPDSVIATNSLPDAKSAKTNDTRSTVATSDISDPVPGWQVQIAAAETESQAIVLLKNAKAKTGSALRGKVPYTEPVKANGQTLYRARFIGFKNKSAAWKACRTLKKAKYACFAIYQ